MLPIDAHGESPLLGKGRMVLLLGTKIDNDLFLFWEEAPGGT